MEPRLRGSRKKGVRGLHWQVRLRSLHGKKEMALEDRPKQCCSNNRRIPHCCCVLIHSCLLCSSFRHLHVLLMGTLLPFSLGRWVTAGHRQWILQKKNSNSQRLNNHKHQLLVNIVYCVRNREFVNNYFLCRRNF